ncbi:MAG: M23 family metallopeptidase [Anaerolineae bacterium]|nr:M23 family metallopeptidase [Anaerolineae bacterium]
MNRARPILILILILIGIAVILLVTGRVAIDNTRFVGVVTAAFRPTAVASNATPIAPYGPLDPAIIPALQGTPGNRPFAVLPSVQPIGVYIPGIPTQTPTPTSTNTVPPTATYSPTATTTNTATPTLTPSDTPTGTYTPHPPTDTPTATATLPPTATRTPTPSPTPLIIPTIAPTASPTFPPTPTSFPTDQPVEDIGVQQLQGLFMTPNPTLVGDNCAPHGMPVNGVLTQRYHYYHSGIDLGVQIGTPVLATHSGQVIFAGWSFIGYGWIVIIQNGHYITYYGHNSSFKVVPYQYVKAGDVIAYSGSTGNSSGPHLHYETRIDDVPVDPQTFDARNLRTC